MTPSARNLPPIQDRLEPPESPGSHARAVAGHVVDLVAVAVGDVLVLDRDRAAGELGVDAGLADDRADGRVGPAGEAVERAVGRVGVKPRALDPVAGVLVADDRVVEGREPALVRRAEEHGALAVDDLAGVQAVARGQQELGTSGRVAQVEAGGAVVAVVAVAAVHEVDGRLGQGVDRLDGDRVAVLGGRLAGRAGLLLRGRDLHAVGDRIERDGRERALRLGDLALLAVRVAAGAEAGLDLAELLEAVRDQARLGAGALDLLEQAAIGHVDDQLAALEVEVRAGEAVAELLLQLLVERDGALLLLAETLDLIGGEPEVPRDRGRHVAGFGALVLGKRGRGARGHGRDHDRRHQFVTHMQGAPFRWEVGEDVHTERPTRGLIHPAAKLSRARTTACRSPAGARASRRPRCPAWP